MIPAIPIWVPIRLRLRLPWVTVILVDDDANVTLKDNLRLEMIPTILIGFAVRWRLGL